MKAHSQAEVPAAKGELNGRHVFLMLVAFFGVVFAVNGVFLASAINTYTGVVSNEPYVKGLKYNERIEAGDRQSKLAWQDKLAVQPSGEITVSLSDDGGRPVQGLKLGGTVARPATNQGERAVTLIEAEPGRYVANTGTLEDGTWVVALVGVSRDFGTDPIYRLRRRVWLKH